MDGLLLARGGVIGGFKHSVLLGFTASERPKPRGKSGKSQRSSRLHAFRLVRVVRGWMVGATGFESRLFLPVFTACFVLTIEGMNDDDPRLSAPTIHETLEAVLARLRQAGDPSDS